MAECAWDEDALTAFDARPSWIPTKISDGMPMTAAMIWAMADHCSSDIAQTLNG
jgi:hypothetical protein